MQEQEQPGSERGYTSEERYQKQKTLKKVLSPSVSPSPFWDRTISVALLCNTAVSLCPCFSRNMAAM